jgi:uncharacterized Zn finger protein
MDDDRPTNEPFSHDLGFRQFARTKRAAGGIKAQMKRGAAASNTWWGQRWIHVLESFDIGARLQRGRAYARKGQVLQIDVQKGEVVASVQGSRSQPYKVSIRLAVLSADNWLQVVEVLAGKALYSAKLLARQMPPQVENAFTERGLSLFPTRESDLKTSCTCPDWSNPCKHIAAVYYLLGEEFDRDPFLIFMLRGLSEDELTSNLIGLLSGATSFHPPESTGNVDEKKSTRKKTPKAKLKDRRSSNIVSLDAHSEPLIESNSSGNDRQADFWKGGALPSEITGHLQLPERTAALARNLGNFPFWRGQDDFWQSMDLIYKDAAGKTLKSLIDSEVIEPSTEQRGSKKRRQ